VERPDLPQFVYERDHKFKSEEVSPERQRALKKQKKTGEYGLGSEGGCSGTDEPVLKLSCTA
jgi:hypothetical protein